MNQYGLWVDASLPGLSIVVLNRTDSGPWCALSEYHDNSLGASNQINAILMAMLKKIRIEPNQVRYLGVGTGPGSFTGIKVGMAWAYGFFCVESPMFVSGFSALQLGARGLKKNPSQILLKVTSHHGFWAKSSIESYEEFPFERSDFKAHLGSGEVCLAAPWPEMESDLKLANAPFLTLESLRTYAVVGLLETINRPGFEWGSEFPGPRYLKLSTAEEKLIQNQEAFLG